MIDSRPLVLKGGAIVDVRSGDIHHDFSLVVQGERIDSIGPSTEIAVPPDAQILDVTGAWLIPGLIDMHVHAASEPLHTKLIPLYLAHGVTTIRDVGAPITQAILLRDDLREGRRLGPRCFVAGPLLDGLPPLWPPMTVLVDTPQRARSAVRMLVDQQVDCIKVYNSVPEASLEVIVDEANAAGLMVLGHVPRSLTTTRAVRIGMGCLEHIRVTGRELLPLEEADTIDYLPLGERETLLWERFELDSSGLHRLIELLAETETFLDPTLIVDSATSVGPPHDDEALALEQRLSESARATLRQDDWTGWLKGPDGMKERSRRGFEKRLEFISMCNEAGVRLLAGTDTFGPGALLPGASLHNELQLLARAGLSPLQALRAATLTAASALKAGDDVGALEAGKLADIVVLDANPLLDVENVRKLRLVVKSGTVHDPESLVQAAVEAAA